MMSNCIPIPFVTNLSIEFSRGDENGLGIYIEIWLFRGHCLVAHALGIHIKLVTMRVPLVSNTDINWLVFKLVSRF